MELLGSSLYNVLETTVDLTIEDIRGVIACIVQGLEEIHEQGIIHYDIKPDNLCFDDQAYVKITDFGISTPAKLNER